MDEVGRGALAGPVSVGAVAVGLSTRTCPQGVADSKLLTPLARERLRPALSRWGLARAVGHASPQEIDAVGIIAALRLAGERALRALAVPVDVVLLDGSHDWLTRPAQQALFDDLDDVLPDASPDWTAAPLVRTRVKADRTCASVAAASVLAKCERDALMVGLAAQHPLYGWQGNKGYGAPEHVEALRLHGPCELHRRSWRLPSAWELEDEDVPQDAFADEGRDAPVEETLADAAVAEAALEAGQRALEAPVEGGDPRWSMMDA
jgi:ribonuclease HII